MTRWTKEQPSGMPFLRCNEIDLWYECHGPSDAPALVLAHGAGGNHLVWWQQAPVFAERYRVVTFDHRSFGLSRDVPGGPGRRAFPYDLHALLDHLGIDDFAMIAHSMGGRTATPFAMLFPGRIRALILSGTLAGLVNDEVRKIQARHYEEVRGQTLRQRALAPATERERPTLSWLYRRMNGWNPPRPRSFLAPTPGLATWRGSTMPMMRQMGMPLLFIVGEHDRIVPAAAMQASHRAMADSEYVAVPDAGHSVYFEQPHRFNAAVLDFLDRRWARS